MNCLLYKITEVVYSLKLFLFLLWWVFFSFMILCFNNFSFVRIKNDLLIWGERVDSLLVALHWEDCREWNILLLIFYFFCKQVVLGLISDSLVIWKYYLNDDMSNSVFMKLIWLDIPMIVYHIILILNNIVYKLNYMRGKLVHGRRKHGQLCSAGYNCF